MSTKNLTYTKAFDELQSICEKLESETVDVDQITALVQRANELVKFCQDKLRGIEKDLDKISDN